MAERWRTNHGCGMCGADLTYLPQVSDVGNRWFQCGVCGWQHCATACCESDLEIEQPMSLAQVERYLNG